MRLSANGEGPLVGEATLGGILAALAVIGIVVLVTTGAAVGALLGWALVCVGISVGAGAAMPRWWMLLIPLALAAPFLIYIPYVALGGDPGSEDGAGFYLLLSLVIALPPFLGLALGVGGRKLFMGLRAGTRRNRQIADG